MTFRVFVHSEPTLLSAIPPAASSAATDYRARARQHAARRPHLERMVVFYRTADLDDAREVEQDLIWHTEDRNVDVLRGGEGLRPGRRAYYVYVLLEPISEDSPGAWPLVFWAAGLAALALGSRRSLAQGARGAARW